MTQTLIKDKAYQLRVNSELFNRAKVVLEKNNYSVASALTLFLKNVAETEKVDLLSEEDLEKERLFQNLQKEVRESIANYEAGNALEEDEVRARFGL